MAFNFLKKRTEYNTRKYDLFTSKKVTWIHIITSQTWNIFYLLLIYKVDRHTVKRHVYRVLFPLSITSNMIALLAINDTYIYL